MEPTRGALILFELRGENPGTLRVISEGVFRIGSDRENELVLKEASISLYQAEIRGTGNESVVKNLAPQGNVFLNGEPFAEAHLNRGDILTLGEAMFRVVFPGESLTQHELWLPVGGRQEERGPSARPLRRAPFFALLTLLAVVVAAVVMFSQRKGRDIPAPKRGRLAKYDSEISLNERRSLYDYGVDLFSARRWDEALLVFERIRRSAPNYKETDRLYQEALEESGALDALTQAKGLYLEGVLPGAKAEIEKIPDRSAYSQEAKRILREIEGRVAEKQLQAAEKSLAGGDWEAARSMAKEALYANPSDSRARQILRYADLQQDSAPRRWRGVPVVTPEPQPAAPARSPAVRKPRTPPRNLAVPGTPEWYFQEASLQYQKGDVEGSCRRLESVLREGSRHGDGVKRRAQQMSEDLRRVRDDYQKARDLQGEGRVPEALEVWGSFLQRDRRLTAGYAGVYFDQASTLLGKIYYRRGKEEFDRGHLPGAFRFWSMADQVNAQDQDVQKGLEQLSASARELYREGYVLQDINPSLASEKWKMVTEIVRPSHPYHGKAREGLEWCRNLEMQGIECNWETANKVADRSPQGLYREGYVLGGINPELAVQKWREVLGVAKPGDPYYQMARRMILHYEESF